MRYIKLTNSEEELLFKNFMREVAPLFRTSFIKSMNMAFADMLHRDYHIKDISIVNDLHDVLDGVIYTSLRGLLNDAVSKVLSNFKVDLYMEDKSGQIMDMTADPLYTDNKISKEDLSQIEARKHQEFCLFLELHDLNLKLTDDYFKQRRRQ